MKPEYLWADEELTTEFILSKMLLWKKDFWSWFTECVYTIDEANLDAPVKRAPSFKYLKILNDTIDENNTTIVEKSRQQFITHFMCAKFLWYFLFKPFSRCILISQRESQVADVIATRIAPIYESLDPRFPWPLLDRRSHIKTLEIEHPLSSVGSLIMGLPSGSDKARGLTATLVWCDEFGFQDNQDQTMRAIKPMLNGKDSKLIITSTPAPNTRYHQLVKNVHPNAEVIQHMQGVWSSKNIHEDTVLSIRYDAHPGKRSEEWIEKTKKTCDDYTWRVEYNLEWTVPAGKPVFDFSKELYTVPYKSHGAFSRDYPLEIGLDFGGHYPAAVFFQKDSLGRCLLHRAILAEDENLDDFLERVNNIIQTDFFGVTSFRLYCDPAGASINLQGTAPPAVTLVENYFRKPVKYVKSKPVDRIRAMKMLFNKRKGNTMGLIINPSLGDFYSKEGKVSHGVMIEGFETGYVYDKPNHQEHYKSLEPKKDGFFDHLFDAFGYGFILVFPAYLEQIEGLRDRKKDPSSYQRKIAYLRR